MIIETIIGHFLPQNIKEMCQTFHQVLDMIFYCTFPRHTSIWLILREQYACIKWVRYVVWWVSYILWKMCYVIQAYCYNIVMKHGRAVINPAESTIFISTTQIKSSRKCSVFYVADLDKQTSKYRLHMICRGKKFGR